MSPFSRSYLRLLGPTIVCGLAVLGLKGEARLFSHDWLAIGASLLASYLAFAGMVAAVGLDGDDRLVVHAMWYRVRSIVPAAEGLEP
jgi:hypothetical protein